MAENTQAEVDLTAPIGRATTSRKMIWLSAVLAGMLMVAIATMLVADEMLPERMQWLTYWSMAAIGVLWVATFGTYMLANRIDGTAATVDQAAAGPVGFTDADLAALERLQDPDGSWR